MIVFIVESVLDMQRPDLFDIKLKENDEEEISIASCVKILKEIKKNFINVNKLKDLSKTISDPNDKSNDFLEIVILKLKQFYDECLHLIEDKQKKLNDLEDIYEKLCDFYGENPKEMKFELFYEIFNKFFMEIAVKYI